MFDQLEEAVREMRALTDQIEALLPMAREYGFDTVSGLASRAVFDRTLAREVEECAAGKRDYKRREGDARVFSLVLLDLDNFKDVNDAFGHQTGDAVLRAVGNLIKCCRRGRDHAARIGGDEFGIILGGAGQDRAEAFANRVLEGLRNDLQMPLELTGSMGVATFQGVGESPESLIARADRALYVAKNEMGRDAVALSWRGE